MFKKLPSANRICLPLALLALGSVPMRAQRLDGCPTDGGRSPFTATLDTLETGLQWSGVATREALTVALLDPKADIRSLAALKLARDGATIPHEAPWNKAALFALMRAWAAESDSCTKLNMSSGLSIFVPIVVHDRSQHPGYQPWITPFQPCRASEPPVLTLTVEQTTVPGDSSPVVRISIQNQTEDVVAFVGAAPEELFSVAVFGPSGEPAKVAKGRERLFEPLATSHLTRMGSGPLFLPLLPNVAQPWIWRVGEDFDMSEPGTYHVSLGGRLSYLDTTVCSNTAEVTVGK